MQESAHNPHIQTTQNNHLSVITGAVLLVLVVGGGLYYISTQNKASISALKEIVSSAPAKPHDTNTGLPPPVVPNDWKTYRNQEFSYSIMYPDTIDIANNGMNSISMTRKTENADAITTSSMYIGVIPHGFVSEGGQIYNYNTKETTTLLNMKVGETKSLREDAASAEIKKAFSYTRLTNRTISGVSATAYVNHSPWEFPKGMKEYRYYVEQNNHTYMIGAYVAVDNKKGAITEQEFLQIVSSFRFL